MTLIAAEEASTYRGIDDFLKAEILRHHMAGSRRNNTTQR